LRSDPEYQTILLGVREYCEASKKKFDVARWSGQPISHRDFPSGD
jgi:hypothetical protein